MLSTSVNTSTWSVYHGDVLIFSKNCLSAFSYLFNAPNNGASRLQKLSKDVCLLLILSWILTFKQHLKSFSFFCVVLTLFASGMQWHPQSVFLAPWAVFIALLTQHLSHPTCFAISLVCVVRMHLGNQCAQQPELLKKDIIFSTLMSFTLYA